MRFWIISVLVLATLVAFEAKPFFTLRNAQPKPMDKDKLEGLKSGIQQWLGLNFDKEKFKKELIHFIKAFGDKEILEMWYKLPKSERECINQAQITVFNQTFFGHKYTPEEALNFTKLACPDAADQIQQLHDLHVQKLKEAIQKVKTEIEKLPTSVQKAIKTLYRGLKKIGVENDEAKLRAAFLPLFEQLLEIPEEDLQRLAEICPNLAPIVTGDLEKFACTIIRSFIKYCTTGNIDAFDEDFFRAGGKFIPYLQEQFKQLCQYIKNAPEQDLPDYVCQGIEEEIGEAFDKIPPQKRLDNKLGEIDLGDHTKFDVLDELKFV